MDQIQPLDVFVNRQMKVIPRRLYDRVLLDELDINISERNNIIRLMSLTHNQLCAEVFRPMIQYAWYVSCYIDNHQNPLNCGRSLFFLRCNNMRRAFMRCGSFYLLQLV
jgi:hypothetical protein